MQGRAEQLHVSTVLPPRKEAELHNVENRQIFAPTGNRTPVSGNPVTVLPEPVFSLLLLILNT
jgi:hypothetical protein